jgi:hypothetical protein
MSIAQRSRMHVALMPTRRSRSPNDLLATPTPGDHRRRACRGLGSARQSPISASSSAAQITLLCVLNSEVKIAPSGCSRMAVAICA